MIIDFHTHLFPDKLARYAMKKLDSNAGVPYDCYPTREELLKNMAKNGVDKSVVLSIATREHQHESIFNFAAEINSDNLIAFGSVMPQTHSAAEYVQAVAATGLKGLKFHPALQRFKPEDKINFPVYDLARSLGLIVLFHAGWDPTYPKELYCSVQSVIEVEKNFPGLKIVAAHMGGLKLSREVLETLVGRDVYFDTAWTAEPWIDDRTMESIIKKHGAEKILFGSDFPWNNPKREIEIINRLSIPASDKKLIMGGNAIRILNL